MASLRVYLKVKCSERMMVTSLDKKKETYLELSLEKTSAHCLGSWLE